MEVIYLLLIAGAVLCFVVAAFSARVNSSVNDPRPVASRVNLVAFGLFLWALVDLIKLLVGFEV